MPIHLSPDTSKALKAGLSGCDSRSLFKDKFNLFDSGFDEDKLVSLNLFLSEGRNDIQTLRKGWDTKLSKQQSRQSSGEAFNRHELDKVTAALSATQYFTSPELHPKPVSFQRSWLRDVPEAKIQIFQLRTASRLIVGSATGTLENAGCTLHPRFGFPIIPGSALKGIALDAAASANLPSSSIVKIFGSEPNADPPARGAVCFVDAHAILDPAEIDLEADVLTPHYRDYYNRTRNLMALDEEAPNPIAFPVVRAGVLFEFVLILSAVDDISAEQAGVLQKAADALKQGLCKNGVGARTASGYGRFCDSNQTLHKEEMDLFPPPPKPILSLEEELKAKWTGKAGNKFFLKRLIADLKSINSSETLGSVFEAVIPPEELNNFRMSNPYWSAFLREGGKAILAQLNRNLPRQ